MLSPALRTPWEPLVTVGVPAGRQGPGLIQGLQPLPCLWKGWLPCTARCHSWLPPARGTGEGGELQVVTKAAQRKKHPGGVKTSAFGGSHWGSGLSVSQLFEPFV